MPLLYSPTQQLPERDVINVARTYVHDFHAELTLCFTKQQTLDW